MAVITVLIVIISILLTLVVLAQKSKGGGLVAGFQNSNQIMGAPKTANFLEKITWGGMAVIAVLCIVCTLVLKHTNVTSGPSIEAIEQAAPALPEAVTEDAAPVEAQAPAADGVEAE